MARQAILGPKTPGRHRVRHYIVRFDFGIGNACSTKAVEVRGEWPGGDGALERAVRQAAERLLVRTQRERLARAEVTVEFLIEGTAGPGLRFTALADGGG